MHYYTLQGFNKEMEEIVRMQKMYAVPDVELREVLKRDNMDFVLPHYTKFYKKYSKVNFSKNPGKYIRYTDRDVQQQISRFFDSSA